MITKKKITLQAQGRGFHPITKELEEAVPALPREGMMNVFVKNTGCGLIILDRKDPAGPELLYASIDKMVPTIAGAFYMPQFIRGLFTGPSLTIPITDGKLDLGSFQGVFLAEHNNRRYPKDMVVTVYSPDKDRLHSTWYHIKQQINSVWKTILDSLRWRESTVPASIATA